MLGRPLLVLLAETYSMAWMVSPGPWLTGLSNGCGTTRWQRVVWNRSLSPLYPLHRVILDKLAVVSWGTFHSQLMSLFQAIQTPFFCFETFFFCFRLSQNCARSSWNRPRTLPGTETSSNHQMILCSCASQSKAVFYILTNEKKPAFQATTVMFHNVLSGLYGWHTYCKQTDHKCLLTWNGRLCYFKSLDHKTV